MINKVLFGFVTFGLMVASAATYNVTLDRDVTLNGKSFKAGEYKLEVKDAAVVVKHGKDQSEVAAKTETADKKFARTSVRYKESGEVDEISLGGTKTRLVFHSDAGASGGSL